MYGDNENVMSDVNTINPIIHRQGTKFLIHVLAEYVAKMPVRIGDSFEYSEEDTQNLIKSLVSELKESLNERL